MKFGTTCPAMHSWNEQAESSEVPKVRSIGRHTLPTISTAEDCRNSSLIMEKYYFTHSSLIFYQDNIPEGRFIHSHGQAWQWCVPKQLSCLLIHISAFIVNGYCSQWSHTSSLLRCLSSCSSTGSVCSDPTFQTRVPIRFVAQLWLIARQHRN